MDAVFTKKEMSESCLIKTALSKSTKPVLSEAKVRLIEGIVINIAIYTYNQCMPCMDMHGLFNCM